MKTDEKSLNRRWAIRIIIGCVFLYGGSCGLSTNAFGVFVQPVCSALGFSAGGFTLCRTLASVAKSLCLPLAGRLLDKYNFKKLSCVTLGIMVASFLLLPLCTEQWQFYACYLAQGASIAFLDALPVTIIINNWFRSNSGIILSLCMCSSGLFSALFSPLTAAAMEHFDWRAGFLLQGVILALFGGIAVLFLLKKEPQAAGRAPIGEADRETGAKKKAVSSEGRDTGLLGKLCIGAIAIGCMSCTTFSNHLNNYAAGLGFTSVAAAALTSWLMAGNMSAKLIFGMALDRFDCRKVTLCLLALATAGVALLMTGVYALMVAGCVLCGCSYSVIVLIPYLAKTFAPGKPFGQAVANYTMVGIMGSSVTIPLVGYCYDLLGTYLPALVFLGGILVLAFVLVCLLLARERRQNKIAAPV